jgi:hypothetical protein
MQILTLAAIFSLSIGLISAAATRIVRGTTLVAPLCWAGLSIAFLILMLAIQLSAPDHKIDEPTLSIERYLITITTFLPAMGVLGAKRPQHWAWQFVVGTLWIILAWPALEAVVQNVPFELQSQKLRGGFLIVLLLVQWSNWFPTRYLLAVTFFTAAQVIMLWPYFPWANGVTDIRVWEVGCIMIGIVPLIVNWSTSRKSGSLAIEPNREILRTDFNVAANYDVLWRDFRDLFGVVWGLRVIERINETARLQNWGWELMWAGFVKKNDVPPHDLGNSSERLHKDVEQAMQTVLRRFVSTEWIGGDG